MSNKSDSEASLFLALDPICDAFESAWQSDTRPRIDDYLDKVGARQREQLLHGLCSVEIEHRLSRGEQPTLAEYLQRFPNDQKCLLELSHQHQEWNLKGVASIVPNTLATASVREDTNPGQRPESTHTYPIAEISRKPHELPFRVLGDYELLEEIGQGGMGVVYKARQKKLDRIVAVKMIRAGQLATEKDIRRFQSEAEAIGQLDHPNIVPIYEVNDHEGHLFFSMAFVEGINLSDKLANGPLPPRQAAHLIQEVAQAIHYAHDQGVVHRDLKPANILLTVDGQTRVTDFGLAKRKEATDSPTVTGDIVGTPGYMSPEQAAGIQELVGPVSDVYSLGAILYSLLTGRAPFQAATMLDTLMQVMQEDPVSPRQLNPAVDRDLETICLRCLDKATTRRYQTAQELAEELGRFLGGHPIQARPVGVMSRTWRWYCRRPVLAAAWTLVAVLLLFLGISGPLVAVHQSRLKTDAADAAEASQKSAARYQKQRQQALKQTKRADEQAKMALIQEQKAQQQTQIAELERRNAKRMLYLAQMKIASSAWEHSNMRYMRRLLDQYQKPQDDIIRGFEWHYLNTLAHEESFVVKGHLMTVLDVAVRSDGLQMASVGADLSVHIRNSQTGELLTELSLAAEQPRCVAYSLNRRWLGLGCAKGIIRLYDSQSYDFIREIVVGDKHLLKIVFLPHKNHCVVSNASGGIYSVDLEAGTSRLILAENDNRPKPRFSTLATDHNRLDRKPFACSKDGQKIVFCDRDHNIVIWDVETKKPIQKILLKDSMETHEAESEFVFLKGGSELFHGTNRGNAVMWDLDSNSQSYRERIHGRYIYELVVTNDEQFVISAGHDRTIQVFDVQRKNRKILKGHQGPVTCLAAAPDGRFVVGGGDDGSLRLFRLKDQSNPNLLKCPDGEYHDLAFHPKEQVLALAQSNGSIEIWDRLGRKPLRTLSGHKGSVACVAYSPDGKQLASGSRDKTIRIWSPSSTKPTKVLVGHELFVNAIAFSPDNQRLASISLDRTLKIWNLAQGKVTKSIRIQNRLLRRVTWSSDGDRVAVGAEFGAASVFDITTGRRVLRRPHLMMAYSPDGKHLVSANRNDVVVHDAASGKEINVLKGHLNPVLDVMVTNQGERVISLDVGGIIKVWGMRTGQELLTITANSDDQLPSQVSIGTLVIGPNDRTLGLAQFNGRIKIWHTRPTDPREQAKP